MSSYNTRYRDNPKHCGKKNEKFLKTDCIQNSSSPTKKTTRQRNNGFKIQGKLFPTRETLNQEQKHREKEGIQNTEPQYKGEDPLLP